MKKPFLLFCALCTVIGLQAAVSKTVNLTTAGTLSTVLTATELTTITDLTLTGTIDARDFATMRDAMTVIANINLSGASIVAYSGIDGTLASTQLYQANEVPENSFFLNSKKRSLKNIQLPKTTEKIGKAAFRQCESLEKIELPSTIKSVSSYAFYGCVAADSILLNDGLSSIEDYSFFLCYSLTKITLPATLKTIGNYSFYGCRGLKDLALPNSIFTIGDLAFSGCDGLISVQLSTSIVSIGNEAFSYCLGITSICLPRSITSIGMNAFIGCTNISSVIAPSLHIFYTLNFSPLASLFLTGPIDARDFKIVSDKKSLFPVINIDILNINQYVGNQGPIDGVQTYFAHDIPTNSFKNDTFLIDIKLPKSIKKIGGWAFSECSRLRSIEIPESVDSIGERVFSGCRGLSSIISLGIKPPKVGIGVFEFVDKTIPLYVPEGAKSLYKDANQWKDFVNIIEMGTSYMMYKYRLGSSQNSTNCYLIEAGNLRKATSDADWLHVSLSEVDFNSASTTVLYSNVSQFSPLWFIASKNTTSVERTARVVVTLDGMDLCIISITQAAVPLVVAIPELTVSTSAVTFTAATSTAYTTVIANKDWTATSDADWLQVSLSGVDFASASSTVSFGSASETTTALWFVAASNTTAVQRTGTISVVAGDVTKQVTVTQAAKSVVVVTPKVELSASSVLLDENGTPTNITVTNNLPVVAGSDADWLHVSLSNTNFALAGSKVGFGSASETTTVLWFVAASNTTAVQRTGRITIGGGDVTKQITVTQAAAIKEPYLTTSITKQQLSSNGQSFWFIVKSNVSWTKKYDASWLTTRMNYDTCFVTITPNVTAYERYTVIYFESNEVPVVKVPITQAGETPYLGLTENSKTVPSEGGSSVVVVKSNATWQVKVIESWITTRISNDSIYYTVLVNTTTSSRSAQIEVSTSGVVSQKLIILQNAKADVPFVSAPTTTTAPAATSTVRIAVSANTTWSALSSCEWFDITQTTTTGNGEIVLTVQANPTAKERKYSIMLTGTNAAGQLITVTQAAGTGVDASEANAESITIYPNPTTAYFTVNTSIPATVAVYTQAGTLLVNTTATSTDQISLDAFAAGTYLVKVTTPAGVTEHTIIKQ